MSSWRTRKTPFRVLTLTVTMLGREPERCACGVANYSMCSAGRGGPLAAHADQPAAPVVRLVHAASASTADEVRIAAADLHAFFSNIERDDKGGHASGSGRDRQQDQYCRMHAALPALPSFEIPRGPFEKREALAILVRLIAARNAIRPARRAPEWRQRDYDEDEAADDDKQIVGKADAGKAPHRHGELRPRGR